VSRATGTEPPHRVPAAGDATDAIRDARRGMRSDIEALIKALDTAPLLVPLARSIAGVDLGEVAEVGEELSLSPHLLFDDERQGFVVVFTKQDILERATERVHWTTDDAPLEFCTLPAAVVLEMAIGIMEDARVRGVLVNPFDETELVLVRHELSSIAQGRAIPLVGYVADIPVGDDEQRLVADMGGPPPEEMVTSVNRVLAETGPGLSCGIHKTFNPERDIEPHFTLNVVTSGAALDRRAIAARLGEALEGKLPPPGYVDILFDDPALS